MGATNTMGPVHKTMRRRHGVATVWCILSLPVLLAGLCLTVDLGKIWVERAALANAVDAAAIAAVRQWVKDLCKLECEADIVNAIQQGMVFAQANHVDGKSLNLADKTACDACFEFGCIVGGQFVQQAPNCEQEQPPAVRVRVRQFEISSACGMKWPYYVSVEAIAVASCSSSGDTYLFTPTSN